jgi:hypothetical protein
LESKEDRKDTARQAGEVFGGIFGDRQVESRLGRWRLSCWDSVVSHSILPQLCLFSFFIFDLIESQIWENVIPTVVTICILWFWLEVGGL